MWGVFLQIIPHLMILLNLEETFLPGVKMEDTKIIRAQSNIKEILGMTVLFQGVLSLLFLG